MRNVLLGGSKSEKPNTNGNFSVTSEALPWENLLLEQSGIKTEGTGVRLSLGCIARGLHNGKVNEKATPGFVGGQEPYYLSSPVVCVTTPEQVLKPLNENGKSAGMPSRIVFEKDGGALS